MGNALSRCKSKPKELCDFMTVIIDTAKLPEMSKLNKQYIYRVPSIVRKLNEAAYTPRVVSIGPFHHKGHDRLEPMQQLKLGYLKGFVERTGTSLEHCFCRLLEWETSIRLCYGMSIDPKIQQINSDEFVQMILIDACFIIEYFIRYHRIDEEEWREKDPLFIKPWLTEDVSNDLILLENQLPFFVLKSIYEYTTTNDDYPSFLELTLNYFKPFNQQNLRPEDSTIQHFTGLLRTFLLPPLERQPERSQPGDILDNLYSASVLVQSGLEFKVNTQENSCLLDLQYHKGVLTMSCLKISDTTEVLMRNVIALEQRHYPDSTYVTDYLRFLDILIKVEKDVDILVSEGIINNSLGNNNEVAKIINGLCKNLTIVNFNSDYLGLSVQLKKYYECPIHKHRASLIREYCNTPWKFAASSAAILILLLTLIQAIIAIISLSKHFKKI